MNNFFEQSDPISRVLIANRGEVAVRIIATCAALGIETVAISAKDEPDALHTREADKSILMESAGVSAYLDSKRIVQLALENNCDAIHPGWGFLSEDARLARESAAVGLKLIGPGEEILERFGDKAIARELAVSLGIPVPVGRTVASQLEARDFYEGLTDGNSMLIKAVAGGGGRGMGKVSQLAEVENVWNRCQAETLAAFGRDDLYVEEMMEHARHIEVQIVGSHDGVAILGDRECTIQRNFQKILEFSPAFDLDDAVREKLYDYSRRIASDVQYIGLGTVEFLLGKDRQIVFLEVNPRLQVEHTITEEITRLDLVELQIRIAEGCSLEELGIPLHSPVDSTGMALQVRVNSEKYDEHGNLTPTAGYLAVFDPPSGHGTRVDTAGFGGLFVSPAYDSLLAKVITSRKDTNWIALLRQAERALRRFDIQGVETNLSMLVAILQHDRVRSNDVSTTFVDENRAELVSDAKKIIFQKREERQSREQAFSVPEGLIGVSATVVGVVVSVCAKVGDLVAQGDPIVVLEAMKMEHTILAPESGLVDEISVVPGDAVELDQIIALLAPSDAHVEVSSREQIDPEYIRPDLAAVVERTELMLDGGRPDAVARRHAMGMRTVRENIADLVDDGSFSEYGLQVLSPQRARRTHDELLRVGPSDGIVVGTATINGEHFLSPAARAVVLGYDWTVFGGTQGALGHFKTDRILKLAERWRSPVVFFTEGGGGRPGDTEFMTPAGLDTRSFSILGKLSGLVPLIGITNRYSFAGNAAFLGCCDVIIATEESNIGMGGPAMIEGGGLGVVTPQEVGPVGDQVRNGVVDLLVEDESEAVKVAQKYLSYFQGKISTWQASDQRILRHLVPENRKQIYDIREVIQTVVDTDSMLELRKGFGLGFITGLARLEGQPVGVLANNPGHLGGAVDSDGSDKAARFMQLCDAFGLPIVIFLDTPGFMVGVEAEKSAQVRHFARMFVTGANLTVPIFGVAVRKGYGLGALASMGGSFEDAGFVISWPTGEFGGMGVEGHVRLAFGAEIDEIEDENQRKVEFERRVAHIYDRGKALSIAEDFEIDGVIDPADTRDWLLRGLSSLPPAAATTGKRRPYIDPW